MKNININTKAYSYCAVVSLPENTENGRHIHHVGVFTVHNGVKAFKTAEVEGKANVESVFAAAMPFVEKFLNQFKADAKADSTKKRGAIVYGGYLLSRVFNALRICQDVAAKENVSDAYKSMMLNQSVILEKVFGEETARALAEQKLFVGVQTPVISEVEHIVASVPVGTYTAEKNSDKWQVKFEQTDEDGEIYIETRNVPCGGMYTFEKYGDYARAEIPYQLVIKNDDGSLQEPREVTFAELVDFFSVNGNVITAPRIKGTWHDYLAIFTVLAQTMFTQRFDCAFEVFEAEDIEIGGDVVTD